jgi:nitrite reductase (NADH) small subunit
VPTKVHAGKTSDLLPGERRRVEVEDDVICIYNVDGEFYATSNICPHAHGPLHQGFVENKRIACPWHGWSFPLDCDEDDIPRDGLWRYRVHIENGDLYVETPAINA